MSAKATQPDWPEQRQRHGWELKQQGWKQQDIAAALGVTPGAVSQWLKRACEQGAEGLRRHLEPSSSLRSGEWGRECMASAAKAGRAAATP